jgi:hypothetical protein
MKIPGERDRSDSNEDAPRLAVFMRGLTIGALVGAAIAGSALWERTRRRAESERPGEPLPTPEATSDAEPGDARLP